jgi:hypothetical protein
VSDSIFSAGAMQDAMLPAPSLRSACTRTQACARLDADFHRRRSRLGVQAFQMRLPSLLLAHRQRIAGVIGQNFLGPVQRRQLQHEHFRTIQAR